MRTATGAGTILVVGDAFCDVNAGPLTALPTWGRNTISPEAIVAHPGGAALNVASNLQRLRGEASTMLFTGIGQDAFGAMLRSHCANLGVRLLEATPSDPALPTGVADTRTPTHKPLLDRLRHTNPYYNDYDTRFRQVYLPDTQAFAWSCRAPPTEPSAPILASRTSLMRLSSLPTTVQCCARWTRP